MTDVDLLIRLAKIREILRRAAKADDLLVAQERIAEALEASQIRPCPNVSCESASNR